MVEFLWLKSGFSVFEGEILGVFGLWWTRLNSDCHKSIYKFVLRDNLRSESKTGFKNIEFWIFERSFSKTCARFVIFPNF